MVSFCVVELYLLTRPTYLLSKLTAWVWNPRSMIIAREISDQSHVVLRVQCQRVPLNLVACPGFETVIINSLP